jgi:outer membrane protein
MKKKNLCARNLLIGLCLLATQVTLAQAPFAQDSHSVLTISSFDSLWLLVLRDNPSERVYALNIQKAVIDHKTSRSFLYPNVGAGFNGQDNLQLAVTPVPGELVGRPGTTYDVRFGKQYTYGAGFSASEAIFNWTSIFAAKMTANAVLLNRSQAISYEQGLREQTARYYYALLVARASIGVAQTDEYLADSVVNMAQNRLDQGLTDATSLNQAKINAGDVRINLAQSRQLYNQAMANLRILLGRQPGDTILVTDTLDIRREEKDLPFVLGPDKNLDVYRSQLSAATLARKQKVAAYYPILSLDGYYGVQQFQDAFLPSFSHGSWSNYSYVGLSLSVPLFTGFATSGNVKSAATSVAIAGLQYDIARIQSGNNDDLLRKQYIDDEEMARASKDNFLLYGDNLGLARQKYGEGLLSLDAYLKVFEDYLTSENAYLNNLSNLYSTRATILGRKE